MTTGWLLPTILSAVSAFAATNLDDILILMFFFSQVDNRFRIRHIVLGQYLGFILLLCLSLPGFFGSLMIPKTWIGLLGFVPIVIGGQQLLTAGDESLADQTMTVKVDQPSLSPNRMMSFMGSFLAPQTYSVAVITLANGGDNIGIYVPFFASLTWSSLLVVLTVFFILVAVWCAIAYGLARHPVIGKSLTRHGKKIVPWVLMGLGLWILWDSESYRLLTFTH